MSRPRLSVDSVDSELHRVRIHRATAQLALAVRDEAGGARAQRGGLGGEEAPVGGGEVARAGWRAGGAALQIDPELMTDSQTGS